MRISRPIAVLDSGLGGMTVLKQLRSRLPQADFVYFGDTARLPYGTKTADTIAVYVRQMIEFVQRFNPRHVVIACNTATALALPQMRREFPNLAMTGVVEPGACAAVEAARLSGNGTIGVLATEATIRSGAYEYAIRRIMPEARVVARAAPLLVPIIEDGRGESDALARLAVEQYVKPLLDEQVGTIVLGCTHYPILRALVARVAGDGVAVIDSAQWCAEDVARDVGNDAGDVPGGATLECFVTDDPQRFARLASAFLGREVPVPQWVSPDDLYAPQRAFAVRAAV